MGWWWGSQSPADSKANGQPPATIMPDRDDSPSELSRELVSPVLEDAKRDLSRDEQSNAELVAFLKELQAQSEERKTETIQGPNAASNPRPTIPDDISPDSLYPTEIHCRSAFDYAFFCQSFGGQFVNVYRYGGFRSCSNHWQDFWLCMRTRNWNTEDRARAIKDHYRKKAIQYKTGPSSEDVWDVRVEPVRGAFQGDLEALEEKIEEWKKVNPGVDSPWAKSA